MADSEPDPDALRRRRERILRGFAEAVPHNRALGIEIVELGDGRARYRLPYDPRLIGNPETGVLHGGAITALLDACCGSAVFNALPQPQPIATLDLRIDYLRPAVPPHAVVASAHCYKVTRNVAFVRAVAYHDDEADPIAAAAGTFMVATKLGDPARRKPAGGGA
ncbi:MAG: PaaI family thioesterase [Kofleriaceae bacterium]|nr:PaaI family thioesterase [Myxococcales bacterium]MCB9560598.1 PaaI family thioesterase [Kofleriaceae bacterium]